MRAQFGFFDDGFLVSYRLSRRNVKHRKRWTRESPSGEVRIADDSNDAVCAGVFGHVHAEMLTDGINAALEEAFDEGLVDEGNGRGGFVVGGGEITSADERDAEGLEIVSADAVPGDSASLLTPAGATSPAISVVSPQLSVR